MTGAEQPAPAPGELHDSETAAARYLGGAFRPRATRAFERHLLACESCWREVDAGRTGRRIAESARQVAPAELREQLRAVIASQLGADEVSAAPTDTKAARRHRWSRRSLSGPVARRRSGVPALGILGLAAILLLLVVVPFRGGHRGSASHQPPAVGAAVADFRALRLPGALVPEAAAPDLTPVHLRSMGAAGGVVGGRPVTAYAYRDTAGRNVLVYLSKEPFPTAVGAQRLTGPDGPWIATIDRVTVLCARSPHALLVLGLDRELVLGVARALDVT